MNHQTATQLYIQWTNDQAEGEFVCVSFEQDGNVLTFTESVTKCVQEMRWDFGQATGQSVTDEEAQEAVAAIVQVCREYAGEGTEDLTAIQRAWVAA